MKKLTITAAVAALSFSILSSAQAGAVEDAPTFKVRYADLDLNRPEGSVELYSRLKIAARAVCRELDPRDSASSALQRALTQQYKACLDNAITGAVAKINRPAFTNYVSTKMTLPESMINLKVALK